MQKVLCPKDIAEILHLSLTTVYKLLKRNEFSWIRLDGGKYFISKKSFDDWFDGLSDGKLL